MVWFLVSLSLIDPIHIRPYSFNIPLLHISYLMELLFVHFGFWFLFPSFLSLFLSFVRLHTCIPAPPPESTHSSLDHAHFGFAHFLHQLTVARSLFPFSFSFSFFGCQWRCSVWVKFHRFPPPHPPLDSTRIQRTEPPSVPPSVRFVPRRHLLILPSVHSYLVSRSRSRIQYTGIDTASPYYPASPTNRNLPCLPSLHCRFREAHTPPELKTITLQSART